MLSERSQLQRTTYYMIPLIQNVQIKQIHRERKQISYCPLLGIEGVEDDGYEGGSLKFAKMSCVKNAQFCEYMKSRYTV